MYKTENGLYRKTMYKRIMWIFTILYMRKHTSIEKNISFNHLTPSKVTMPLRM